MNNDVIQLWRQVSRAYQIAKLGNFTIKLVADSDYKEFNDDWQEIVLFYKDVYFTNLNSNSPFQLVSAVNKDKNPDLIIEIQKPYNYIIHAKSTETLEKLNLEVDKARNNTLPIGYNNTACQTLLTTASNRLNFSYKDCQQVFKIAQVIAQLEGTKMIQVEHVAEAVQYRAFNRYHIDMDVTEIMCFGKNIDIKKGEIEQSDIDDCIKYLTSLKK